MGCSGTESSNSKVSQNSGEDPEKLCINAVDLFEEVLQR